jgi:ABC-type uncharacterized transport system auxiliary subunit
MKRRKAVCLAFTIISSLMICACIGAPSTPKTIDYYTLDYPPHAAAPIRRLPVVLRVNRFSAAPPFDTQRIVYAEKNLHRNTYAYHQWIATPGEILSYLLTRDLNHLDGFKAVLPDDTTQPASHDVYGWVEELIEIDTHTPWQASARIHITLASALDPEPSRRILMQKRYERTEPCRAKNPAALAEAMSQAIAAIYADVVHDIHARLAQDY